MISRRRTSANRARWKVHRERHQLDPSARPESNAASTHIGEVLPDVMKHIGLESRFWEQSLIQEWHDLAGPQLARHTRPGRMDRGVLCVFVTNSAWLSELSRFGRRELLGKVQGRFGADRIRDLRFQLDPDMG